MISNLSTWHKRWGKKKNKRRELLQWSLSAAIRTLCATSLCRLRGPQHTSRCPHLLVMRVRLTNTAKCLCNNMNNGSRQRRGCNFWEKNKCLLNKGLLCKRAKARDITPLFRSRLCWALVKMKNHGILKNLWSKFRERFRKPKCFCGNYMSRRKRWYLEKG
jgi:hypothetical protein